MKKRVFTFIYNRWAQFAIGAVVIMFISHLVAFIIFSNYSEKTQVEINRGIIARQIITLIEAVEINPPDKRAYVVNAIDIPNIYITLDKKPRYHLRVSQLKIWDILLKIKSIPENSRTIELSVRFNNDVWLNIAANIVQSSWAFQAWLFLLEFVIVIALIFMIWSFNRFNKPLNKFIKSVERVGRSLNSPKLDDETGPQIVREAAKAINNMQERIRSSVRDRTQMLAAISHDLRTPLTRLKLRAQLMEDEDQRQKVLDDLNEMESMINESLSFSRNEEHTWNMSKIDIASVITSLVTDYQEVGRNVTYHGPHKSQLIEGNALALRRAFSNLIDNALKYATRANIFLNTGNKAITITVKDNGPGIPEEDLENVFKPFYRGESSRSRSTGGIGLGLAAVRNLIVAHGGEVSLHSREEGGLSVQVTLPLK